jgi:uncharacterized protein YejL (UPF0352 family)
LTKYQPRKIKQAQADLISLLEDQHGAVMKTLNKGDKPTDEIQKTITEACQKVAKSFAVAKKIAKAKE